MKVRRRRLRFFVSVASKTASFALLLRLFLVVFWGTQVNWMYLVAGIAVASLTWGNLAALTQTNVKRLLAYSSISHAGYVLLGLVAGNKTAMTGIGYYLLAYIFMTAGAFAILIVLRQKGLIGEELEDLNGLYQRSPSSAVPVLSIGKPSLVHTTQAWAPGRAERRFCETSSIVTIAFPAASCPVTTRRTFNAMAVLLR